MPKLFLNLRTWAALMVALFYAGSVLEAYIFGHDAGELKQTAKHTAEKLDIANQTIKTIAKTKSETKQLTEEKNKLRKDKDAQINSLNSDLAGALERLRDRPQRASAESVPGIASAEPATSCTGAQLYQQDAGFLTRESDRAQHVLADLAECQAAYGAAEKQINKD